MPVLVTGVERAAGMAVVRAFLRSQGQVRAYVDPALVREGTVAGLRSLGVKTARGGADDEGRLEAALEQVHTVVHAGLDPMGDPDEVVEAVATMLSAALGARCARVVLCSHLGADDPSGNRWLAACAEAEMMLAEAPMEGVVLRRALTYGPGDALTEVIAAGAAGASPDALHAPLWIEDLAAALVAADARDRERALPHLVVPLGGPEQLSLGELIARLGGQVTGSRDGLPSTPPAPGVPDHVIDLISRDLVPDRGLPTAGTSPATGAALVRMAPS